MTGILALAPGARPDRDTALAMREALHHRGPDDGGLFVDGSVALGFRRLSVIDIPGGHQPMIDEETGVALAFNGEIYNFESLRAELERSGHRFRTRCDTEVLLRSYLEWGHDALERLVGMFAFALWDPRHRRLLLARDRFGIKPMYWSRVGDELLFASEVKALLRHPRFTPKPSLDGISSYLTFRQAVWDLTLFEGVERVLPGQALTVEADGRITSRFYWRLPIPAIDGARDEDFYTQNIEALLANAVGACLISDVPVGAYLSGGVDSSLMVALMRRLHRGALHTFSIGYGRHGYDEGRHAEQVARHLGTEHHHETMRQEDFQDTWPALVRQRDAPLSIPHEIPLLHLSRQMKRSVSVALAGDGADELFGGYGRVFRGALDWRKIRAARSLAGARVAARAAALPALRGTPLAWLRCANQMEHFFETYHWLGFEEKWALFTPDARATLDGDARTVGVFRDTFAEAASADPYDRVLHVFQKIHLGCLLDKVDAIGMAASIEGRVPFVDHRLVEFVVHMPFEHKLRWNSRWAQLRSLAMTGGRASERLDTTKYLLRRIAADVVPPSIAGRPKLGFPTPLDAWLETGMLDFARELLLDPGARTRDIFEPAALRALLSRRDRPPHDFHGKKVWMLANVELWLREVVEQTRGLDASRDPAFHTA